MSKIKTDQASYKTKPRVFDETPLGLVPYIKLLSGNPDSVDPTGIASAPLPVLLYAIGEDGNLDTVRLNGVTSALVTMDVEHGYIHTGKMFLTRKFQDIGAGATVDFLVNVPNNGYLDHFYWRFYGEGEFSIILYEGTTVSANGTAQTIINMNRNSATTPTAALYQGPTVTGTGTELFRIVIGSGKQVAGELTELYGLILKLNTKYLFRCTNTTNGTLYLSNHFQWTEVP